MSNAETPSTPPVVNEDNVHHIAFCMEDSIRRGDGFCDALQSMCTEIHDYEERIAHAVFTLAGAIQAQLEDLEKARIQILHAARGMTIAPPG